ncbi:MAG: ribonuclease P protein component [Hyphomicrobiales bacterium]|nr:ribonuclease P protein component [Hyphomicrobiales bacterium]
MLILKRRQDFLRLKAGRRWSARAFVLQAAPQPTEDGATPDAAPPRFGFTVSDHAIASVAPDGRKKGGAAKRNRARRRLKEAVRLRGAHSARPGHDYVIVGRRDALNQDFSELLADMEMAFHKVHEASHASKRPGASSGDASAKRSPKGSGIHGRQ